MTRHIKRRIRQLQHLEKALMAIAAVFFLGFLITASCVDSTSWLPLVYCAVSIGAAGVIGYASEHVSMMITTEQEKLAARIERMEMLQRR